MTGNPLDSSENLQLTHEKQHAIVRNANKLAKSWIVDSPRTEYVTSQNQDSMRCLNATPPTHPTASGRYPTNPWSNANESGNGLVLQV